MSLIVFSMIALNRGVPVHAINRSRVAQVTQGVEVSSTTKSVGPHQSRTRAGSPSCLGGRKGIINLDLRSAPRATPKLDFFFQSTDRMGCGFLKRLITTEKRRLGRCDGPIKYGRKPVMFQPSAHRRVHRFEIIGCRTLCHPSGAPAQQG